MSIVIEKIKKAAVPVFEHYGVVRAAVFGSIVRGEFGRKSDIDILVEMKDNGAKLSDLRCELKKLFGRKVDAVQYRLIKERLRARILSEAIPIYGENHAYKEEFKDMKNSNIKRDYGVYVEEIKESVEMIEKYIGLMTEDEFLQNTEKQDAVAMRITTIVEAVKKLPKSFIVKYPEIPWEKLKDIRNKIVHPVRKEAPVLAVGSGTAPQVWAEFEAPSKLSNGVHEYDIIDFSEVWKIVKNVLPGLKDKLYKLLGKLK